MENMYKKITENIIIRRYIIIRECIIDNKNERLEIVFTSNYFSYPVLKAIVENCEKYNFIAYILENKIILTKHYKGKY